MDEQLRLPPWATNPFRPGRVSLVIVALLLLGLVGIARLVLNAPGEAAEPPAAASPAATTSTQPDASGTEPKSTPTSAPTRLLVPSLTIDAGIDAIEMDPSGVLTPPSDVDRVGWWQRSAHPGATEGQVLLTGHSVRLGDGALDDVADLSPGDRVEVVSDGVHTAYETVEVAVLSKAEVAERARELFGQEHGDGDLVIVTCTDWDGTDYESNVIVRARLAD